MTRTFTALRLSRFPATWYSLLPPLLLLVQVSILAQPLPGIDAVNGLVPGCATQEQALALTINGSNFVPQAQVRIRGTAFSGEYFFTPATPPSSTQIALAIPANSVVVADPGTLTIDVQQPDAADKPVFSNAVQLPVYPKTGAISGPAAVCGLTQTSYSVARLTGAASYAWSVVSGNATIVSGGTTHTARISFANGAGTVSIAVTTLTACGTTGATSTLDIQVNAAPTVSLAAFGEVCTNAPAFALSGGSPAGGTYTVDGVVATSFNPATAGVGSHNVTYYFSRNGCTASATQTLIVQAAPEVSFAAFNALCVDAAPLELSGGSPAGGSYSGPGVTGSTFDPAVAGAGTHTITYTVTQNGCSNSASQILEVVPLPEVSLAAFGEVCVNAPAFALSGGSPAGGTYTVDGVVATSFNPAAAGVGTYTVAYTVTRNGCTASATQTLRVKAAPVVSLAAFSPICINAAPLSLAAGSPAGGSYSGPGVSGSTFDPAVAGVGTHTITYTATQNGCSNSATRQITVLDAPAAGILEPAGGTRACLGDLVTLTAAPTTTGASYQWLLNGNPIAGAVNSSFEAGASGLYQVQVTAAGCSAVSQALAVTILAPANVIVEQSPVSFCADGNIELHALAGEGYQYQWYRDGDAMPNRTSASLRVSEPGAYHVVLTPPGCASITSEAVTVTETPQITDNDIATTAGSVICTGPTVAITGSAPAGGNGSYTYQWQRRVNNGNIVNIPGATGPHYTYETGTFAGTISFWRIVTSGRCTNTSSPVTLTVNQVIANNTIAAPALVPLCAGQVPGTITGSTATGAPNLVYSWESRALFEPYALIPGANMPDYSPPALSRTTIFRRVVRSGDCTNISHPDTITVQAEIAGNSITAPAATICSDTDAGTLTGGPLSGGDGPYSYVWESSPDGTVFTAISGANTADYAPGVLAQTTTFRRRVRAGVCSSISNALTITVEPAIAGNSIAGPSGTICSNTDAGTLTGGPLSGGDGPYSYVWESSPDGAVFTPISGANTADYAPGVLAQSTTFRRRVRAGACSSVSNALTITVEPVATYTLLLTVSALPVCGEALYRARMIRNVSSVRYPADVRSQQVSWMGGEDVTELFVFDWWQSDQFSLQTGNTSGTVTLAGLQPEAYYTVRARPVSLDLDCAIFNNRPDLVPAGAGAGLLFSNKIYSGHAQGYGVSITADAQGPICPGTAVTFTAFPNDPAYTNPTYQWMVNRQDIPGANQPTFTASNLQNGDVVTVRFNSDENECSPVTAANPVTMQLMTSIANSITRIAGPAGPEIGQPATYQAVPADNTIGWRYQWTLTYTDGRRETLSETSATLTLAQVPANLHLVSATQIAPAGNCVDRKTTTLAVPTQPLPVALLYLKARNNGRYAVVEWATALELHNAGFQVQVSEDAAIYRQLGFVPSKNPYSVTRQAYTFADPEQGQYGTRYYRLKQVDFTGDFTYYGPVAVRMDDPPARILAYPNPFIREIRLEIGAHESGNMHLVLLNTLGSKVAERTLPVKKGFNKEQLRLPLQLPVGQYTLLLHLNGRSSLIKLVKR